MRKSCFLLAGALLYGAGAAFAQRDIVVGDMNDDGRITVSDITALSNVAVGKTPMRTIAKCNPNVSDPEAIAGRWVLGDGRTLNLGATGSATLFGDNDVCAFEYYPYSRDLLLLDASGVIVVCYHVLRICDGKLSLVPLMEDVQTGTSVSADVYEDWTSDSHEHGLSSSVEHIINFEKGDLLEFDWAVSSEKDFDFLRVCIDGKTVVKRSGEDSGHYSKVLNYTGTLRLMIEYAKDNSASQGKDEGRVYNVAVVKGAGASCPAEPYEYVDLGLPSGTLWATRNVGANAPEDGGDYFAWGEVEPKNEYVLANYKYYNGSSYYKYTAYYGNKGDNRVELDLQDDAAYVNWGSDWQTPNNDQFAELMNKEYTLVISHVRNGISGLLVESLENGNSIFLPFTGIRGDADPVSPDSSMFYHSRTNYDVGPKPGTNFDYYYEVDVNERLEHTLDPSFLGMAVRPVRRVK